MRIVYWFGVATLLVACGKKQAPEPAGDQPAAAPAGELTAEMPDTPEAKAFAKRLVETTVTDWDPLGGASGVELRYKTLTFQPDGSWTAEAALTADFESFECKEVGTWSIDEAESDSAATMNWEVRKTTCPTREAGDALRVKMGIQKGGEYKIAFR